jgi:hypothetical protein
LQKNKRIFTEGLYMLFAAQKNRFSTNLTAIPIKISFQERAVQTFPPAGKTSLTNLVCRAAVYSAPPTVTEKCRKIKR